MEVATLVEFFSPNPIENVLGAFAFTPRRLVFLVGPGASQDAILSTQRALERRIPGIQIRFFSVPDTQLPSIVRTLEELWREYPDSVFDFTGGSEPMLLSAYAFAYQHDAPMLHINIQNHCFINIHRCEELAERFAFPQLTLEDHLSMNGTFLAGYGYPAPDPQWFSRIRAFCALVLEDQHRWKEQCLFIQMAAARSPGLTVDSEPELRTGDGARVSCDPSYLLRLTEIGMLSSAAMVGGAFALPSRTFSCGVSSVTAASGWNCTPISWWWRAADFPMCVFRCAWGGVRPRSSPTAPPTMRSTW